MREATTLRAVLGLTLVAVLALSCCSRAVARNETLSLLDQDYQGSGAADAGTSFAEQALAAPAPAARPSSAPATQAELNSALAALASLQQQLLAYLQQLTAGDGGDSGWYTGPAAAVPAGEGGTEVTDLGQGCIQLDSGGGKLTLCGGVAYVTPQGPTCSRVCFADGRCLTVCTLPGARYSVATEDGCYRICDSGGCVKVCGNVESIVPSRAGQYEVCYADGTCETVFTSGAGGRSGSLPRRVTPAPAADQRSSGGQVRQVRDGAGNVVQTWFNYVDQDGNPQELMTPADVDYRYVGGYRVERYIKYRSCNGQPAGFWDPMDYGPAGSSSSCGRAVQPARYASAPTRRSGG